MAILESQVFYKFVTVLNFVCVFKDVNILEIALSINEIIAIRFVYKYVYLYSIYTIFIFIKDFTKFICFILYFSIHGGAVDNP